MADFKITPLFGGSDFPELDISYGHFQADSNVLKAELPPYIRQFRIPDSYVTAVKLQQLDNCWIYSSTAMYETFALSQGYVGSNTEDAAVLSETYMTYAEFDTNPGDAAYRNPDGKQTIIDSKTGQKVYKGSAIDALAFFMRGDAHVMEACDPIDPATAGQTGLEPRLRDITANKPESGYVTGFKFLEQPNRPFPDQSFIDDVKKNLFVYGPVTAAFYFASERMKAAGSSLACCCEASHPVFTTAAGSHSVCIIGWDDDYAVDNFNSNFRPKKNGAFLAKNSWGSGSGYDGYVWISYEDETMNGACCITDMDADFYKKPLKVMTHAPFGFMHQYFPVNSMQTEFKCVYETTGEEDMLYAVGLVCASPCLADVTMTAAGKTTTLFSGILLEYSGYRVKELSAPLAIGGKNTSFEITVVYRSVNGIPVSVPVELGEDSAYTNVNLKSGDCFVDGKDLKTIAAADKKNYGNIAMTVILQADSDAAKNALSAYEDITVPKAAGGRIDGLCTSYGLVPVDWRMEPYQIESYNQSCQRQAQQYRITDAKGEPVSQGIVNTGAAGIPKLYLTALIGEADELILRKACQVSLDAAGSYAFMVSKVTDDNMVDITGSFPVHGSVVNVSCNGQTGTAVVDDRGDWEVKSFRLYDPAKGWKDEYANSQILVELCDNQAAPVRLCSGTSAVSLSSPIKTEKDSKGGWIVAIIGIGVAGIMAALAFACKNGCAGGPVTIQLGGKAFRVGKGFGKNQPYTKFEGGSSGNRGAIELEDGPFDSLGGARDVDFKLKKIKVELADGQNTLYYGGLTRELSKGGSLENCTASGSIESGGKSSVGVFFGTGGDVTVINCRSNVEVTGAASCGGIAGMISGKSTVSGCEVSGTLAAAGPAAGIAAEVQGGEISDCCVTANVSGGQAAGIAAVMSGSAAVKRCFASGRIMASSGGSACGIAPGIDGTAGAVAQCVSVCAHIGGERIGRVSLFPGTDNVAYTGMHCDSGRSFADDGASLRDWYEFAETALYTGLGWNLTDTWEFVEALMYVRLKGSTTGYSYPFFVVAQTQSGRFQMKVGSEITLTGSKNEGMPEVKWTGIMPQKGMKTGADNFWASANTYILTVPFVPVQAGNYNLGLEGSLENEVYSMTLPLEVIE